MIKRSVLSREPVPNYIPKESEIHRVVHEDGDADYICSNGHRMHVYENDLDAVVSLWIDQLKSMVKLLDDDDYLKFGQNFTTLLNAFGWHMDEVMEAVAQEVGWIQCYQVGANAMNWREGRIVGIEFEPAEKSRIGSEGIRENERASQNESN